MISVVCDRCKTTVKERELGVAFRVYFEPLYGDGRTHDTRGLEPLKGEHTYQLCAQCTIRTRMVIDNITVD